MSDDNTPVDMDDLEAFENAFYQREPVKEVVEEEVVEEVEEEANEAEEDSSLATEEESEEEAEEEEETEEVEPEPKPKPKSKAQQRIEQLLERERLANERAEALERRLSALEAGKQEVEKEAPTNVREQLPANAPNPDAVDDKGEPLYPLGEFDPAFILDLTRFSAKQAFEAEKQEREQEAAAKAAQEMQAELTRTWGEKVEKAEEEIPELRQNITALTNTFSNLEPSYGEYLAMTIMGSEVGPQIMNYLSQNIGEAQRIVASGPAAATLALGRLEARLTKEPEDKRNLRKVSEAPVPPEARSRGSGGKFTVAPDTDDLEAFEREFFKKK